MSWLPTTDSGAATAQPQSDVKSYLRHAKKFGIHRVFETAREDGLSPLDLAQLVKGLRALQKERRQGWHQGVPHAWDRKRRGWHAPSDTWTEPQGILTEDQRRLLVRDLISANADDKLIRDCLGVTKAHIDDVRQALAAESSVSTHHREETLMPQYILSYSANGEAKEFHTVRDDPDAAKANLREVLGVSRLPRGVKVKEVQEPKAKKPSWKDLPAAEKADHLLATTTIPDRAWTEEQREKGESRSDFIRRVLLGETSDQDDAS